MTLARAIATVGGFTMLSRITGFARDILIAGALGAGTVSDAFFVAFKFPNLFRRLFAEGAFAAAFVPLYAGLLESDGKAEARLFAERAMAVLGAVLLGLVAVMEIVMPWAMLVFAPGFAAVPGKLELAVELSRITFPYLLFISLVALESAVLNSLGRFAAAAAAPVLLNLTLMAALLGLSDVLPSGAQALAVGTFVAGLLQLVWVRAALAREGVVLRPRRPRLTPRVRLLVRRVIPGAVGAGVYQLNLLVDVILASLVADGAVSYLYFADRVTQLPLGVVGTAVGTALLPLLSRRIRAGDGGGADGLQNRALEVALLLTLPAAAALLVAAEPLVAVLFERGAFTAAEAGATAAALAAFAVGLPAYVLIKVLAPGFFAREDTATPVKVASAALAANVVLNLLLMGPLGHVGIALATALSAWLNAGLLAVILLRRGHLRLDARLKARLPRIAAASAAMAVPVAAFAVGYDGWHGGDGARAAALAALVLGGAAVYGLAVQALGAARLGELRALLRRGGEGGAA